MTGADMLSHQMTQSEIEADDVATCLCDGKPLFDAVVGERTFYGNDQGLIEQKAQTYQRSLTPEPKACWVTC